MTTKKQMKPYATVPSSAVLFGSYRIQLLVSFVALSGEEDSEKIAELEEYAEPVEDSVLGLAVEEELVSASVVPVEDSVFMLCDDVCECERPSDPDS